MSRRTTILLDDDIYERLVNESMRKYKTTKAMSKVANELLKRALKGETKVLDLIFTEKLAKANQKEFEIFRRELSKRFESLSLTQPTSFP
jgi:predicted CopG family antitoxin